MRTRGLVYVTLVYLLALTVAAFVARVDSSLLGLGLADLAATVVVFAGSVRANNSSVYDPYWSVIPMALAAWFARGGDLSPRAVLVLLAVATWGVRLTWNWARGWQGLGHEDWRYVDIRRKTGRLYWGASLLGLHTFPSVLTFLGSLPMLASLTQPTALWALDALAAATTFGAIAIETVADEQLRAHRRASPGQYCPTGLWRYSRHPNYFGEILFWVGLWLFGVAAGAPAWMALGPVAMVALFVFASIPMAEKRSLARRPDYAGQIATVSMLVPWFPKR